MAINFISSQDSDETRTMHKKKQYYRNYGKS